MAAQQRQNAMPIRLPGQMAGFTSIPGNFHMLMGAYQGKKTERCRDFDGENASECTNHKCYLMHICVYL